MNSERDKQLHLGWNWHKEHGLKGILNPSHHLELKFDDSNGERKIPSGYTIFYTFGLPTDTSEWTQMPEGTVSPVDQENIWQIETRGVLASIYEQMEYGVEVFFKAVPTEKVQEV